MHVHQQNRQSPKNNLIIDLISTKLPRKFNGERWVFSTNDPGEIGYLFKKKKQKQKITTFISYHT